jgi:phospholipase/lecithinase/hemolysin
MTSPLLQTLNQQLDAIDAALLAQDAPAVTLACQALQALLQERSRQGPREDWSEGPDMIEARLIEQRLQRLRQTLQQQGAAASRALAVLLPDLAPAGYGAKSAFGVSASGPHTKRYEA